VLFLASLRGVVYISGQTICVDGGYRRGEVGFQQSIVLLVNGIQIRYDE
jgi:hypothetical protein